MSMCVSGIDFGAFGITFIRYAHSEKIGRVSESLLFNAE
jgi:hypothetical protein